jgi:hypothetical protein
VRHEPVAAPEDPGQGDEALRDAAASIDTHRRADAGAELAAAIRNLAAWSTTACDVEAHDSPISLSAMAFRSTSTWSSTPDWLGARASAAIFRHVKRTDGSRVR